MTLINSLTKLLKSKLSVNSIQCNQSLAKQTDLKTKSDIPRHFESSCLKLRETKYVSLFRSAIGNKESAQLMLQPNHSISENTVLILSFFSISYLVPITIASKTDS